VVIAGFWRSFTPFTAIFLQGMPQDDRRFVVLLADDKDDMDGLGPYWEYAGKTIAPRLL